jgi:hypothetical protein
MAPIMEVDLEQEEIVLDSVAAAETAVSSELSSYEGIPLADLTDEQILSIATNGDFLTVHTRSKEVGMMVMKFIHYFERFKPLVVSMKEKLCAPRGSKRRTMVDGQEVTWSEYCTLYYGCSYRWVQKLLDGDYVSIKGEDAVDEVKSASDATEGNGDADVDQTETKKPSRKDVVIAGLQKKNGELITQVEGLVEELIQQEAKYLLKLAVKKHEAAESEDEPVVEREPADFDIGDPYLHFHQFRDEPQTMASELAAMLLEFHMDEQQTTTLLDLLKKQLKAQRKALAAA